MAHRTFTDARGLDWEVWEVRPGLALIGEAIDRRRLADRREGGVAGTPRSDGEIERRSREERRVAVSPPLRGGWLAFRTGDERRRLAPIPVGWAEDSDIQLAAYCEAAKRVGNPAEVPGERGRGERD